MKKTTFEVSIEDLPFPLRDGSSGVSHLPNVGEKVKPLAKIASGGELSRIMLAMKGI